MERGGPTKETPADPRRGDGGGSSIRGGGIYKSNKTVEQQLSGSESGQRGGGMRGKRPRGERASASGISREVKRGR